MTNGSRFICHDCSRAPVSTALSWDSRLRDGSLTRSSAIKSIAMISRSACLRLSFSPRVYSGLISSILGRRRLEDFPESPHKNACSSVYLCDSFSRVLRLYLEISRNHLKTREISKSQQFVIRTRCTRLASNRVISTKE